LEDPIGFYTENLFVTPFDHGYKSTDVDTFIINFYFKKGGVIFHLCPEVFGFTDTSGPVDEC